MSKLIILLLSVLLFLSFDSCKSKQKKQEKKPVKKTVVHKPIVDSLKQDSLRKVQQAKAELERAKKAKSKDRYFLIAGSFQSKEYAEQYKTELEAKGYKAQIITRDTGPNPDFYKVAYKSFHDRSEALAELERELEQIDILDVWVLVKK